MEKPILIRIVDDEHCPRCGTVGSPKVGDEQGRWWWKCLAPVCTVGFWLPETGEIEERPSPEEMEEIKARSKARVEELTADRPIKVEVIEGGCLVKDERKPNQS